MKLMKEFPSPNVTMIRNFSFPFDRDIDDLYRIEVIPNKNIFIFYLALHTRNTLFNSSYSKIESIFNMYMDSTYPVNVTGFKTAENSEIGSMRFCTMNASFAKRLTNIIKNKSVVDIVENSNSKNEFLKFKNVSQYFRFMKYSSNGEHYPHFDSDFEYKYNNAKTHYSLVMYFNECNTGELAFMENNPENVKSDVVKDFLSSKQDLHRQAKDDEIYLKIKPEFGKIVLFPHTLPHSVLPFKPENKNDVRMICRGDLIFKPV